MQKTTGQRTTAREETSVTRITAWQDWEGVARLERTKELRLAVDAVFSEKVMGALALLLIPILVIPDLFKISHEMASFLAILDIAIWFFFVMEYICRFLVAENRLVFVSTPWNIIDLVIVGVPAVAFIFGIGWGISRYFRILRAMQAFQVLVRGGRTVGKHLADLQTAAEDHVSGTIMRIRAMNLAPAPDESTRPQEWRGISQESTAPAVERRGMWLDFSNLAPADLPALSRITAIPAYTLEAKLKAHSYTRAESHGPFVTVFLRIPRLEPEPETSGTWRFSWDGMLLAYDQNGVMTFSKTDVPILDTLAASAAAEGIPLSGPGILYLIVREELSTLEDMVLAAEEQILHLEALPMNQLPSNFLAMMYTDQKVQSRISSGLLHTKTALEEVSDQIAETLGKDTPEEGRLRSLIDRCSSIAENSQHVADSFSWMVDFYLNTTSFSMNRVMKILAVLTALTMVPTIVGGLLGMNLIGNPWPATLFQMVTIVSLVMLLMAWIYYNIGWLKQD